MSPKKNIFLVLMHGGRGVSTKQLAHILGVKAVSSANIPDMEIYTGYVPGGVSASICGRSPDAFGTRTTLSNYAEETILRLERIYINGGKRGFLVAIQHSELARVLDVIPVRIGIERTS